MYTFFSHLHFKFKFNCSRSQSGHSRSRSLTFLKLRRRSFSGFLIKILKNVAQSRKDAVWPVSPSLSQPS